MPIDKFFIDLIAIQISFNSRFLTEKGPDKKIKEAFCAFIVPDYQKPGRQNN